MLKKVLWSYLFRIAKYFLCGCCGADDSVTSCAELQVECETTDQLQAQFSDGHSIIHNLYCLLCQDGVWQWRKDLKKGDT